jgi:hypothetical protein
VFPERNKTLQNSTKRGYFPFDNGTIEIIFPINSDAIETIFADFGIFNAGVE